MPLDRLLARAAALPTQLRIAAAAAIAGLAVIAVLAAAFGHTDRSALFASALHPEQLADVEERLAEWNVPFTPLPDNVVVDTARRNDLLLKLSLAGVPHAHVPTTEEALANVGVLTPQAVVDAQTRSGLDGDIEMALRSVSGVDDARVIIAPARNADFADQTGKDASASVRLQMHPGAALSAQAVSGIRQFVAAGVPGLDAARVTILDDRGVALNDAPSGDDSDALQKSLQSALDVAFGAGASIVRVHADYLRSSSERHDVRRVPVSSVAIERTAASETFSGPDKRYRKSDERDDRGSDTEDITSRTAAGGIARLSTAVFVDAAHTVDLAGVRALAAATVGYDARRGDTLTVEAVDFHRTPEPIHDGWYLLYGAVVPLLPTLAIVIGVLIAGRWAAPAVAPVLKGFADRSAVARTAESVSGYEPARVRGVLAHEPPHAAAAIISALPAATAAAVLELYPPAEREAIVKRMQRQQASIIPDAHELFGRHV